MLAKDRGIKYFRVMNKQELLTVLQHPEKAVEIGQIARVRWMKKGPKIPLPPKTQVATLTAELERKSTAELMRIAHARNIPNFRVMRKKELLTVLSDPTKYDEIQIAVKARLRAARQMAGTRPGTTRADELGLTDVQRRKDDAIDMIVYRSNNHVRDISDESYKRNLKKWLDDFDVEVLELADKKGLEIGLYNTEREIWWAKGEAGYSGCYQPSTRRVALVVRQRGYKKSTFDHEIGHFIQHESPVYRQKLYKTNLEDYMVQKKIANENTPERFRGERKAWMYIRDENTIISAYSTYDNGEHIAEAVKYYMRGGYSADKLKRVSPSLYNKLFKYLFKGRTF